MWTVVNFNEKHDVKEIVIENISMELAILLAELLNEKHKTSSYDFEWIEK